jgi:hypothetical protein
MQFAEALGGKCVACHCVEIDAFVYERWRWRCYDIRLKIDARKAERAGEVGLGARVRENRTSQLQNARARGLVEPPSFF